MAHAVFNHESFNPFQILNKADFENLEIRGLPLRVDERVCAVCTQIIGKDQNYVGHLKGVLDLGTSFSLNFHVMHSNCAKEKENEITCFCHQLLGDLEKGRDSSYFWKPYASAEDRERKEEQLKQAALRQAYEDHLALSGCPGY